MTKQEKINAILKTKTDWTPTEKLNFIRNTRLLGERFVDSQYRKIVTEA